MKEKYENYIVAIDGPNSSGKSTLAKELAKRLGITYVDTGAMYRALGYYFIENCIEINEENAKLHMREPSIELSYFNGKTVVKLNENDISDAIRTPEIAMAASDISTIGIVREYLVEMQRNMVKSQSVVMEGRDIASVVFPNADVKIYLDADIMVRAQRRLEDYRKLGRVNKTISQVKDEIEKRDFQDMNRENSPLIKVEDAILLNNTNMTFEHTVDKAVEIIRTKVKI